MLATRIIKTMFPPKEMNGSGKKVSPNYRTLWAILRNANHIFGPFTGSQSPLVVQEAIEKTSLIASAIIHGIKNIASPHDLCDAMVSLVDGDLLKTPSSGIYFFAPGEDSTTKNRKPWLCDILAAILGRGEDFNLSKVSKASQKGMHSNSWSEGIEKLSAGFVDYLNNLKTALEKNISIEKAKSLRDSVPVPLIGKYLLVHCSKDQGEVIQNVLLKIDV